MLCFLLLYADLSGPLDFRSQMAWRQTEPEAVALAESETQAKNYLGILDSHSKSTLVGDSGELDAINGIMPKGLTVTKHSRLKDGWLFTCNQLNVFISCANETWWTISKALGKGVETLIRCFEARASLKPLVLAPKEYEMETPTAVETPEVPAVAKTGQRGEVLKGKRDDAIFEQIKQEALDLDSDKAQLALEATAKEIVAAQEKLAKQMQAYVKAKYVKEAQKRYAIETSETGMRVDCESEEIQLRNDLILNSLMFFAKLQNTQRSLLMQEADRAREQNVMQVESDIRNEILRQMAWDARRISEEEIERKRQQVEKKRQETENLYGKAKSWTQENKILKARLEALQEFDQQKDDLTFEIKKRSEELTVAQLAREEAQRTLEEERRKFEALKDTADGAFKEKYAALERSLVEKEESQRNFELEIDDKKEELKKKKEELKKLQLDFKVVKEDVEAKKEALRNMERELINTKATLRQVQQDSDIKDATIATKDAVIAAKDLELNRLRLLHDTSTTTLSPDDSNDPSSDQDDSSEESWDVLSKHPAAAALK